MVRVVFDLLKPLGIQKNPHPVPLPEYMERGKLIAGRQLR
jgi:hypothetical protein